MRLAAAVSLLAIAVGLLFAAWPHPGEGSSVGLVVAALTLAGVAVASCPYEWSEQERDHRELAAIWRRLRADADEDVPWNRYVAWAEADGGVVELVLIRRAAGGTNRTGGAPSPYTRSCAHRLPSDDMLAAAEAMERLRADALRQEHAARERHAASKRIADQLQHEQRLNRIDADADAELQRRLAEVARESAERDASECATDAQALARALRRP